MNPGHEIVLGKRLQNARQKADLTQQELCQKAGLSYSTLAKIERGAIKSPSIFTIQQIATALDVSLDELVGFSREESPQKTKTLSKSGVGFIYFDVNGCLVRFFHRAFTKLAQDTGESPDVIETAFWHYNDAICTGEMSMQKFNKAFGEKLGLESLDWQKYYLEAIDPIIEMQELVVWAAKHYHVGLLTNVMPGILSKLLSDGVVPDINYSAVIDSSEVKVVKPDPKIYEIAQERANCPAEQILFVDDSRVNLMAAERLGWRVLWFDDFNPVESSKRVKAALQPAD